MKVIVLDVSYQYISTVTAQRAIKMIYEGVARAVENTKRVFRSVSTHIPVPSIICLMKQVRTLFRKKVPWNKWNVFIRDKYKCQYCGVKLKRKDAQVEHILPKSRGGRNSFENCTTSCGSCNTKKGGRTPGEAGMSLRKLPYSPTIHEWLQAKMELEGVMVKLKEAGLY